MSRISRVFAVVAVATGSLLGPLGVSASSSTFPGINGPIAFWSTRDGDGEIFLRQVDGTEVQLTNNSGSEQAAAISPDGTKIAFSSDRDGDYDIYVMNSDGTNVQQITNLAGTENSPSWAPNGLSLLFNSGTGAGINLYSIGLNGQGLTSLTPSTPNAYETRGTYSPDGTKIAYESSGPGFSEIHLMNADGTGDIALTTGTFDYGPSWSPDGLKFAFTSSRDSGFFHIYSMNSDGTGQTRLTTLGSGGVDACWSPDGTKIAFSRTTLWEMNADGSGQTQLTSAGAFTPSWGPGQVQPSPSTTSTTTPSTPSDPIVEPAFAG